MKALPLLVALLLVPTAVAQIMERPAVAVPGGEVRFRGDLHLQLMIETVDAQRASLVDAWFLAGHDTLVNATIHNQLPTTWNGTFRVNVTGATAGKDTVTFSVPPRSVQTRLVAIHPEDVGMVQVRFESIDAFFPGGEPVTQLIVGPSLLVPSVRFVDPPLGGGAEDAEYELYTMYGGIRSPWHATTRVGPGDAVRPRLEIRNDLPVATPAFELTLQGSRTVGPVEVRALEPGASYTVELPEFTPVEGPSGGGRHYGGMGSFEFRAMGEFTLGGASRTLHLASYRLERGATTDLLPAYARVDVAEGLAIDLLVPRDPRLGVPTRVKVNLSNDGRDDATGTLFITLGTPGGLHYEVQGPEARSIRVDLAPGERLQETIEFTPRVTGQWGIQTSFRSPEGFGYGGGGGGFQVAGPVGIRFRQSEMEYARIGENVRIDLSIDTERTLQDAQLRVTSGAGYYSPFGMQASDGAFRPGLMHRLLEVETSATSLGTLRPGGVVNATIEVSGRSSGRYEIVPYVLAEGFAFTSRPPDPSRDEPRSPAFGYGTGFHLAVQPRALPPALALAPLTLGLAVFVGTWTLRTRFVK